MPDPIKQALDDKVGTWTKQLTDTAGFTAEQAQKFVPAAVDKVAGIVKGGQTDAQKVMAQLNVPDLAQRAGVDAQKATAGLRMLLPEAAKVLRTTPEAKSFVEGAKGLLGQLGQQVGRG